MVLKAQMFDYSINHDYYTVITELKVYYAFIDKLKI